MRCIHLSPVGLLCLLSAFLWLFLCPWTLIGFEISVLAWVSWAGLASRAISKCSKLVPNWKTMTKNCHKFGKILHDSCFCDHKHSSMVPYSYWTLVEVFRYGVAAGAGELVVAVVLAKDFETAFSRAVLLAAWIAELGDARLEMVDVWW